MRKNKKPVNFDVTLTEEQVARWLCLLEAIEIVSERMDDWEIEDLDLESPIKHDKIINALKKYIKERYLAMLSDVRYVQAKENDWLL